MKRETSIKTAEGCINLVFKNDKDFSKTTNIQKNQFQLGNYIAKQKVAEGKTTNDFNNPETIEAALVKQNFNLSNIGLKVLKQTEAENSQAKLGVSVHELLANYFDKHDRENIQKKINSLADEKTTKLVNSGLKILNKKNWLDYKYHVYCERDLINENGEILRPDRLMINDEEVIVLDYKTGAKDESYSKQLQQYHDILNQLGFGKIEKYILYLETEELVSV